MKQLLILAATFGLTAGAFCQEGVKYNRSSLDAQFGLNNPVEPMTSGYDASTLNLYHVGLGFRYMANTKFGVRVGLGYDNFRERPGKPDFTSEYYRASLEGVANLGNMMDFQTWTRRLGLLLHMGGGYAVLNGSSISPDHMMFAVVGFTPQVRLTERFSMYTDASVAANMYQDHTFDLRSKLTDENRGIKGYVINVSLGFQYNFGPNPQHADWVVLPNKDAEIKVLQDRLNQMEQRQRDDDGDGVVNWLDEEPGTPAGTMVDTKGRAVAARDSDSDNIPDDVDNCPFEKGTPANKGCPERTEGSVSPNSNASTIALIEQSEVKFETDKSELSQSFKQMLAGIATVLKDNPSYKLNVTGHADDRASEEYNMALSQRRADAVRDHLVSLGVSGDRITTTAMGETQPKVQAKTVEARAENRRVQFDIR